MYNTNVLDKNVFVLEEKFLSFFFIDIVLQRETLWGILEFGGYMTKCDKIK